MASTALLFASSLAQAIGNLAAGSAARKQAEFQADVTRQQTGLQAQITEAQARREKEIALAEESDFRRSQSRILAARRAALGGSGIRLDTGTPLLAIADFAAETELQALRIRQGGDTTTARLKQQAELFKSAGTANASLLESAGRTAQTRGFFRAGSSLLSGQTAFS